MEKNTKTLGTETQKLVFLAGGGGGDRQGGRGGRGVKAFLGRYGLVSISGHPNVDVCRVGESYYTQQEKEQSVKRGVVRFFDEREGK